MGALKNGDQGFLLEDSFVAPWGLAKEERPLHLLWEGDIDELRLGFAQPVEILGFHNTKKSHDEYRVRDENGMSVYEISTDELYSSGYFSAEFRIPEIFDEVMVGQIVAAEFCTDGEIVEDWRDYTCTIRPKLEIKDFEESVTLTENGTEESVNIQVQYIGFGLAEVEVTAEAEGEIISEGESIYHDLLNALLQSGIHKKEREEWDTIDENEEYEFEQGDGFQNFVEEFRDMLTSENVFEEYDQGELNKLAEVLEEDEEVRDTSKFYERLQFLLMNSILDVVNRHPTENVQLASPQTKVKLENQITQFTVKYHLSDPQGNQYETTSVGINIDDQSDNLENLEMEINTEWEHVQLDPDEERKRAIEEVQND